VYKRKLQNTDGAIRKVIQSKIFIRRKVKPIKKWKFKCENRNLIRIVKLIFKNQNCGISILSSALAVSQPPVAS